MWPQVAPAGLWGGRGALPCCSGASCFLQSRVMALLIQTAGSHSGPRAASVLVGLNLKWALKRLQEPGVDEPSSWSRPQHQPVPAHPHFQCSGRLGEVTSQDHRRPVWDGVLWAAGSPPLALAFCGRRFPLEDQRVSPKGAGGPRLVLPLPWGFLPAEHVL